MLLFRILEKYRFVDKEKFNFHFKKNEVKTTFNWHLLLIEIGIFFPEIFPWAFVCFSNNREISSYNAEKIKLSMQFETALGFLSLLIENVIFPRLFDTMKLICLPWDENFATPHWFEIFLKQKNLFSSQPWYFWDSSAQKF